MQMESETEPVIRQKSLPLWPFVAQLYQAPGMERICLELQDGFAINVNVLLWCMWMDFQQLPFHAGLIQCGSRRIALWHYGCTLPLRYLRRSIPKVAVYRSVRTWVGQLELAAEKRELRRLEQLTQGCVSCWDDSMVTIENGYLTRLLANVPSAMTAKLIGIASLFSPDQTGSG